MCFWRDRDLIAQVLLDRRLPSIAAFRENTAAGALISYGFDLVGLFRDIAGYVDRYSTRHQTIGNADRVIFALSHGGQFKDGGITAIFLCRVSFIARANEVIERNC